MNIKRFLLPLILIFIGMALIGVAAGVFAAVSAQAQENASSVAIIGGADGPTASLLTAHLMFRTPLFKLCAVLGAVGGVTIIVGIVTAIVKACKKG